MRVCRTILLALMTAACSKAASSHDAILKNNGVANANASAGQANAELTISASPPPQSLVGRFDAYSTTAMSVTGNLTVVPGSFMFEMDQNYNVGSPMRVNAAATFSKSSDSWAGLLIAPKDAIVSIWPVTGQKIGAGASVNGGLCGKNKVGFIATVATEDGLHLAAFSGNTAPGADAPESALCGTYNYFRAK